jgi:hypothetical protein
MATSRPASARGSKAVLETALIVGGLVFLLIVPTHEIYGDDTVRFAEIELLIHHGRLTADSYSLIGPLFSAPFLLLGELVGSPRWWASHFNVFVVSGGLLALFRLTRGRVDPGLLRTFTLVLLFGSLLTEGMRSYGPETLTATLVGLGTLAVATGRHARLGWAGIVVGVANTPAALGGLVLVAVARAFQVKRLRPLLAVAAAALLVMAEAWLRRGSPFTSGLEGNRGVTTIMPYSGRPGFSYPFVLGLASILFSFGRGLLFFTPGLFLALGSRTRRLVPAKHVATLQVAFVVGLAIVYAKWWAWYGGLGWGPRYFIFAAVPASLFLAARLHAEDDTIGGHAITLLVLTLSCWVGFTAALGDLQRQTFCSAQNYQFEALCWYTPEYSGLWWPVLHHTLTTTKVLVAGYFLLVFAYLAAPLARAIGREIAPRRARWIEGWRF